MTVATYDPGQVFVVYAGFPITGFADSVVKIEANEDDFKLRVGADGEACRARTRNRSGKMTFELLQSSASNAVLNALRQADIDFPTGTLGKTLVVRTPLGLYTAARAWIMKMPDVDFAKETGSRQWVFETDDLDAQIAGEVQL